jgi:hypothetical protein
MTRLRLAAPTVLSICVLLVTATGGEAAKQTYRFQASCKTRHTMTRDFAKGRGELMRVTHTGGRRGGAAALVPVEGAKMITKLVDLTLSDGNNNVVDRKKSDLTNAKGVAKTKHEFDAFGNYRMTFKVKVNGNVVADDAIDFGVSDRVSGKCDPPLAGAG